MSRAHAAIGDALLMLGRNEEARTEYAAEPVEDFRLAGHAIVERKLGNLRPPRRRGEAGRGAWRPRAVPAGPGTAQWGEHDAAIARLQRRAGSATPG